LRHTSSPLSFCKIFGYSSTFCSRLALDHDTPTYTSAVAGISGMCCHTCLVLWYTANDLTTTFFLRMAWNHDLPISASQVTRINVLLKFYPVEFLNKLRYFNENCIHVYLYIDICIYHSVYGKIITIHPYTLIKYKILGRSLPTMFMLNLT
jgi:hypothetical protein